MKNVASPQSVDWIALLNEQAEWQTLDELKGWIDRLVGRVTSTSTDALQTFWDSVDYMRSVVYDVHFGKTPDFAFANRCLGSARFAFHEPGGRLPLFRARAEGEHDDSVILSLQQTVMLAFAQNIAALMESGEELNLARCEGLYRDSKVSRLSPAPNIADDLEIAWRLEVPALAESGLESSSEILRCADLFLSSTRSKYCSNACRTNTFQIVKQLKDPVYLAERQRRYRARKK